MEGGFVILLVIAFAALQLAAHIQLRAVLAECQRLRRQNAELLYQLDSVAASRNRLRELNKNLFGAQGAQGRQG